MMRPCDHEVASSPTSSDTPHAMMWPPPCPRRVLTHHLPPHTGRMTTALRLVPPHATTTMVPHPRLALTHLVRPSTHDDDGTSPSRCPHLLRHTHAHGECHTNPHTLDSPSPRQFAHTHACAARPLAPLPPVYASTRIRSRCHHASAHALMPPRPLLPVPFGWSRPLSAARRPSLSPRSTLPSSPLRAASPILARAPHRQPSPSPALRAVLPPVLLRCRSPTPPSHRHTATLPLPSLPLVPFRSLPHAVTVALSLICSHPLGPCAPTFTCTEICAPSHM